MCGFLGLYGTSPVATELYEALMLLQHRGQDAAGMITYNGDKFHIHKGEGLVADIFNESAMMRLKGSAGIAHVRYPTLGGGGIEDAQPLWVSSPYGIAMAHNGNIFNYEKLRADLHHHHFSLVNTGCDVEIILNLFADALLKKKLTSRLSFNTICQAVKEIMGKLKGSYSVVAYIAGQGMVAFRDPFGLRPAIWGKRNNGFQNDYIFASEKVVLDVLGFEVIDDIKPGEVIFIDQDKKVHQKVVLRKNHTPCIFEYIYFARPDSMIDKVSVYKMRLRLGEFLANKIKKLKLKIDNVVPVPDSARSAGISLAQKLGIDYKEGLIKNRYIGRTFIMPGQEKRRKSVRQKLNPSVIEIKNKNILLVDDSIVRGTTSKEIIEMVREVGAKKVYLASTAPAIRFPCLYGIDMPSRKEFAANGLNEEGIAKLIGADKVIYQDLKDCHAAAQEGNKAIKRFCMACFDGKYPTGDITAEVLERAEMDRERQRVGKKEIENQLRLL